MKTIGVIGGMGPQASIDFYSMLIEESVKYGAKTNMDFPHILLSNLPVPDFIQDRRQEEQAIAMVEKEAIRLENAGASFLVIPCNTMHVHIDRFSAAVDIPLYSMIDVVVEAVVRSGHRRPILLASPTTVHSRLFANPLERAGVPVMLPSAEDQRTVTHCILETIAATTPLPFLRAQLEAVMEVAKAKGSDCAILGCTELPVILRGYSGDFPIYASSHLLAQKAIEMAL